MGLNLSEMPEILGISKAMLFAYRKGGNRITNKVWIKLEQAEAKHVPQPSPAAENVEPYAKPKENGVGESANVLREEPPMYGAKNPDEGRRDMFSRDEEIVLAFRQIRAGLDLLESIMMKGTKK